MKKTLSLLLAVLLTAALLPLGVRGAAPGAEQISDPTVIDTDGSDGYTGDYVVIYNPSNNPNSSASTGNMSGRIETEIEGASAPMPVSDGNYRLDVDPEMAAVSKEMGVRRPDPAQEGARKLSFNVGDRHTFMVLYYSPLGVSVEFKVLAKGEHCYIWTPTSTAQNVWPLDSIDASFAQLAADTFDSKYDLMRASFGEHANGSEGDGRLNILYYNIDDGWQPGQGYVGGYFSPYDLSINDMPMLHIDTYPGVHSVSTTGEVTEDMTRSFSTMVHEYQHLIQFSECDYTDTWINEMMSAAAEEICFPGSSVYPRLQSWTNHRYTDIGDWADPPAETAYNPAFELQNGFPMYGWSNDIEIDDILVLYAQVSLFAQYIYSRAGNSTFRSIMQGMKNGREFPSMCSTLFGMSDSDFIRNFRIALTANTSPEEYGGIYSFSMQEGYDPSGYYDVANLYSLLCPVVFTGNSCSVKGGGAICVKPVGGVYTPPSNASSNLRYIGVTRNPVSQEHRPGDVDMNGTVNSADALIALRAALGSMTLTQAQFELADMDGNGVIDSRDALIILRMALGLR